MSKTITIKSGEIEHEYTTDYPTVGQLIEIKRIEHQLSSGNLTAYLMSPLPTDNDTALDIKGIAHMTILFPKMLEDLMCKSLLDLRYDDYQKVQDIYIKEIFPWITDWRDKLKPENAKE